MNPQSAKLADWRRKTKQKLIDYKGGMCQRCGYSKQCLSVYDFHHRNPDEKEFSISKRLTYSLEKLKKEADKCDLFCKNCHAEVHDEEFRAGNSVRTRRASKKCFVCNKKIDSHYKFCSLKCSSMNKRKVTRPSRKKLVDDLNKMSWLAVGRKYGVSDNAVRKWARQYNLL